jgi:sugar fermentation stimulation protein A
MQLARQGYRAVLLFCVQHEGARAVRAAHEIDPVYARTLTEARAAGVEVLAYRVAISSQVIALCERLPFVGECA